MNPKTFVLVLASLLIISLPGRLLAADGNRESSDQLVKQVLDEARATRSAEPPGTVTAHQPLPGGAMVNPRPGQSAPAGGRAAPDVPPPSLEQAARQLVEQEHQRLSELQADRTARLMTSAKEHLADGRLDDAARDLQLILRQEPRNPAATALLDHVRAEQAKAEDAQTGRLIKAETAAALRGVDSARVPYAALLVPPRDATERGARPAAHDTPAEPSDEEKAAATLQAALSRKISIDALEMPLIDVAEYLRHAGRINIILVGKEEAKKTVSIQLENVSLRSVLASVTRLTDTAYSVRNGAVYLGTPAAVAQEPVVRIYDVTDILYTEQLLTRGARMKRAALDPVGRDPFENIEVKDIAELATDMMEFIKEVAGPGKWDANAAQPRMDFHLGRLVVNAEPSLQETILEVLDALRR